jgi:hypothetical protein
MLMDLDATTQAAYRSGRCTPKTWRWSAIQGRAHRSSSKASSKPVDAAVLRRFPAGTSGAQGARERSSTNSNLTTRA